jgi:hypothetical protein
MPKPVLRLRRDHYFAVAGSSVLWVLLISVIPTVLIVHRS